ncbi:reverse transcriptase domain-containing protein [Paraburkholderia phymatum]|uniref:reverse transcriptase domain-containing protein n=1 Tax=Paraburkholderia phymatum TaxID=148447 RepID=UPI00317232B5
MPDSYGYRPGKSAKQAIAVTRTRCWRYDWVVEFDIKAAFDQIDHALLMKAVRRHISAKFWRLRAVATRATTSQLPVDDVPVDSALVWPRWKPFSLICGASDEGVLLLAFAASRSKGASPFQSH